MTQNDYLSAMGIDVWVARDNSVETKPDWQTLQQQVQNCQQCALHQTRQNVVFGVGNPQADYMFIGEAPGMEEDRCGEPFVGQAGKLLNEIIYAMGFAREDIYIANIIKCRPPNNRNPLATETTCCSPFLQQQIAHIQPKMLIALGAVAAQFLLKTEESIGRLRGKMHHYENIPLIATYHPAYLLRSPLEKRKVWQDLKAII